MTTLATGRDISVTIMQLSASVAEQRSRQSSALVDTKLAALKAIVDGRWTEGPGVPGRLAAAYRQPARTLR